MRYLLFAFGFVALFLSNPSFGRPLQTTDCAYLVQNDQIQILSPYGDGGTEIVYRDQLEGTIELMRPSLAANRRAILGFFDMMNFIQRMNPATPGMIERAQLDMTGAYFLVANSDTDGFSFAMNVRIVKEMYDRIVDAREEIPASIRTSVFDSVLQAARPELRKHANVYTWAGFVQFPVCQLTGKQPGGEPLEARYTDPVRTIADIVKSEAFGRFNTQPFEDALAVSYASDSDRWKSVGWLLVASANARPEQLRREIVEKSASYLRGATSDSDWDEFLKRCNRQFIEGRVLTH